MRRRSRVTSVGLSVSAILVVMYALIMIASLLLVGVGTTHSWQTAFLGIGWSTIAEFEIGLFCCRVGVRTSLQRIAACSQLNCKL